MTVVRNLLTAYAILGVLTVGYGTPVLAQTSPPEEVVISGTRLTVTGYEAPTPVTVMQAQDLELIAPSNIPDALNVLPQFTNSRSPTETNTGGPAAPTSGNYLNLRSVGFHRVLVLLDGQRLPPTTFEGGVDTNILPQMLVKRVDVVTAGASAAYGSDAISGVVNFVLDRKFDGVKGMVGGGRRSSDVGDDDDASARYGLALGRPFLDERLHLMGSFEYYSRDGIQDKFKDSAVMRTVPLTLGGGTPTTVSRTFFNTRRATQSFGGLIRSGPLAGQQFLSGGVLAPFDPGMPTANPGVSSGGDGAFHRQADLTAALETTQSYGRASFEFTPNIAAFVSASYAESDSFYGTSTPAAGAITIFSENAFLTDAQRALLGATPSFTLSRGFEETGALRVPTTTRAAVLGGGLEGKFGDGWNWAVNYTHGDANLRIAQLNQLQVPHFAAATDAVFDGAGNIVCRVTLTNPGLYPGCVPINLFGAGSITPEAEAYSFQGSSATVVNELDNVNASIGGSPFSLPAGPVNAVAGVEYREELLRQTSTADPALPVDFTGLRAPIAPRLFNSGQVGIASGSAEVKEFFAEMSIPLLRDRPFAQLLELNGGARYTDYSTSGEVTTWKGGFNYVPVPGVRFRGAISHDIRAPSLFELFAGQQFFRDRVLDRHTGVVEELVIISGGNPNLEPEIGETSTIGVVLQPEFLPGFSASVDYWELEITDGIALPAVAREILEECTLSGGTSPVCSLVFRPFPFSDTSPQNFPLFVLQSKINIASELHRGFDFELSQRWDLSEKGKLDLRLLGSYIPTRRTQARESSAPLSFAGAIHGPEPANGTFTFASYPKLPLTLLVNYNLGPLNIFVQERYISRLDRNWNPSQVFELHDYKPAYYTDLSVSYGLAEQLAFARGGEVFVHVTNLFDKQPPFVPDATVSPGIWFPTSQTAYDVVGRYVTAGLRFRF